MSSDGRSASAPGPQVSAGEVRTHAGAFELDRDVVVVTGRDAVTYLQSQVSADVTALGVGESTWALLLEPNGRLAVWGRVTRAGDEALTFDVDHGWGEVAADRLRRFVLRVDVTVEASVRRWLAFRGPASTEAAGSMPVPDDAVVVAVDWRGLPGVDVILPADVTRGGASWRGAPVSEPAGDVPWRGADVLEILRIEQGWPAMGRELDGSSIPAEAGAWLIDASVSFKKGCYTGQELVARIHSRGSHTPRHLRGLVLDGEEAPVPGTPVLADGVERATVTSATISERFAAPIALAMVHRSVEPGSTVDVGGRPAAVVDLPFS